MDREEFLHYFQQIRGRSMPLVRGIPPDKMEWTCRAGEFTLGDLARHMATTERYVFAECSRGRPSRYKGCGRELADGPDDVVAFMERRHSESMEIFSGMTQEDLEKKATTLEGASITAWKLLRAMLEQEVHHRGQIYVYLGILGVPVPPLYTLNARQVEALSS